MTADEVGEANHGQNLDEVSNTSLACLRHQAANSARSAFTAGELDSAAARS